MHLLPLGGTHNHRRYLGTRCLDRVLEDFAPVVGKNHLDPLAWTGTQLKLSLPAQSQVSAGASLDADPVSFAPPNTCKVSPLRSNGRSQVAVGHLEAMSTVDINHIAQFSLAFYLSTTSFYVSWTSSELHSQRRWW